jgi:glutathione S-transferase
MSTPDPQINAGDLGTLEIFGIPFSTFTRSITLSLEELDLGLHYIQHHTPPHSAEVKERNPLGQLPVLVHRPDAQYTAKENVVVLFESNAIRRYIDDLIVPLAQRKQKNQVWLTPRLEPQNPSSAVKRALIDQWVSVASTVLFSSVEFGVVKPRLAMEKNQADDATIHTALEGNIEKAYEKISIVESMIKGDTKYLCGDQVTWADLFVYPPLADFRSVKEVSCNLCANSFDVSFLIKPEFSFNFF